MDSFICTSGPGHHGKPCGTPHFEAIAWLSEDIEPEFLIIFGWSSF